MIYYPASNHVSSGSMQTEYALFDSDEGLVDSNFSAAASSRPRGKPKTDCAGLVAGVLSGLKTFDGVPVASDAGFLQRAARRWKEMDKAPVEAETNDGRWK